MQRDECATQIAAPPSSHQLGCAPHALDHPHRPREALQLPLLRRLEQRGVAVLGAHGFRDQDLIRRRFRA
jgi:hypothetical protein